MNYCSFSGKLVRDPEVKYAATQKAVTRFAIGVKRNFKNKEGKYETDFFECVAFDKRGEMIGNSFGKGSPIIVWGAMRQEKWQDKDGNNRSAIRLYVDGFDFVEGARERAAAKDFTSSLGDLGEEIDF